MTKNVLFEGIKIAYRALANDPPNGITLMGALAAMDKAIDEIERLQAEIRALDQANGQAVRENARLVSGIQAHIDGYDGYDSCDVGQLRDLLTDQSRRPGEPETAEHQGPPTSDRRSAAALLVQRQIDATAGPSAEQAVRENERLRAALEDTYCGAHHEVRPVSDCVSGGHCNCGNRDVLNGAPAEPEAAPFPYRPEFADPECTLDLHHGGTREGEREPCDCKAPYNVIPQGMYRVFNSDWSIASEGKAIGTGNGYRCEPPPPVGPNQRLVAYAGPAVKSSPADLVDALQDVVHTDPGPVRAGHAVKSDDGPPKYLVPPTEDPRGWK